MLRKTPRPHFTPRKDPFYRRLGGPQGRSGRVENLTPTWIRSPDRPARRQSLYRLSYPASCVSIAQYVRSYLIASRQILVSNPHIDVQVYNMGLLNELQTTSLCNLHGPLYFMLRYVTLRTATFPILFEQDLNLRLVLAIG